MAGKLAGVIGGEEERKVLCGLGCWAALRRGFSVSLDNWTVTWKRCVTQKIHRSTENWSANTAMWLQTGKPCQAGVWATKVTGIMRHWADRHFLINKLVLAIHWLMGLKGNLRKLFRSPLAVMFFYVVPFALALCYELFRCWDHILQVLHEDQYDKSQQWHQ